MSARLKNNSMSIIDNTSLEQYDILRKTHAYLMAYSAGLRNDDAFACMIASNLAGQGAMPKWLGLDEVQYNALINLYYPGTTLSYIKKDISDIQIDRSAEKDELYELLMANKADSLPDTTWMATIITTGCMGSNHLWQDLGLWDRPDLTCLMNISFPDLARRNDKNMKWKKFLYKQLCQQEGIYTCRSPSCEVCADYKECFAPE